MIACQAQVVGADCLTRYAEGQSQDHRRYIRSRSGTTRGRWLLYVPAPWGLRGRVNQGMVEKEGPIGHTSRTGGPRCG